MTDQSHPVLSIIMPVRNEGGSLSIMLKVLPPLIGTSYEILIVHDDQEDTSLPAAESARADNPKVRVVHNRLGRGVINAVRAGVATARGHYVLIFAADEIGPVFIIRDMLALMDEGCDLVCCTRYAHGGGRLGGSLLGRILSTTANFLFRKLTGSSLSDLTTGIKMFRRERFDELSRLLLAHPRMVCLALLCGAGVGRAASVGRTAQACLGLESRPVGWAFAFEIAVKAEAAGWRLGEVPMVSIDRLFGGASSFRPNPWIREYMRWFVWGIRHLRKGNQQPSKVRIPYYRGSGAPANPAASI
jgi:dolichol-phosphate mannosyltransferase